MAANKKDFSQMNTDATNRVSATLKQSTGKKFQQDTADAQEIAERRANLRTQGRKGCSSIRINMAFTPDNHRYIKIMAKATGMTMTEYTNLVIEKYRKQNPGIFDKAQEILEYLDDEVPGF